MRVYAFLMGMMGLWMFSGVGCMDVAKPVGVVGRPGVYWVQGRSGKTHNASCRYFGRCKGYRSAVPSGVDCKICGGASRG